MGNLASFRYFDTREADQMRPKRSRCLLENRICQQIQNHKDFSEVTRCVPLHELDPLKSTLIGSQRSVQLQGTPFNEAKQQTTYVGPHSGLPSSAGDFPNGASR